MLLFLNVYCLNVSGNKKTLVKRIKDHDRTLYSVLYKTLDPAGATLIDRMLHRPLPTQDAANKVVSTVGSISITQAEIRQFDVGNELDICGLRVMCALFTDRDARIIETYADINSRSNGYTPLQPFCFIATEFMADFISSTTFIGDLREGKYRKIFICFRDNALWKLLVIDRALETITYVTPALGREEGSSIEPELATAESLRLAIEECAPSERERVWKSELLKPTYWSPVENNFDTGVYIVLMIYCMIHGCPIIIDRYDIKRIRHALAYFVLSGEFPL